MYNFLSIFQFIYIFLTVSESLTLGLFERNVRYTNTVRGLGRGLRLELGAWSRNRRRSWVLEYLPNWYPLPAVCDGGLGSVDLQ